MSDEYLQKCIERFESEPVMSTYPQIVFANKCELSSVAGCCAKCKKEVPNEYFRGIMSQQILNESGQPSLVSIDGHVICEECHLISPVLLRVRAIGKGMQMEAIINGKWQRAMMSPEHKFSVANVVKRGISWMRSLATTPK